MAGTDSPQAFGRLPNVLVVSFQTKKQNKKKREREREREIKKERRKNIKKKKGGREE